MKVLLILILWCVLLSISWPLAILAAVLFPIVWLVCLPFRFAFLVLGALFAFLKTVLFLPARLFGYRG